MLKYVQQCYFLSVFELYSRWAPRFYWNYSTLDSHTNTVISHAFAYSHPRRHRGSQSGWERRRDESFQVRAKEPLGTDSHRTISKNSSRCRLLIGHKKCFVLLCPIGEQLSLLSFFSWVRTRRLLSRQTCLVRSPRLCVQGKLLFSTFLTRNKGTFGMLSAGANQFAPRIFCFWRITMYRK